MISSPATSDHYREGKNSPALFLLLGIAELIAGLCSILANDFLSAFYFSVAIAGVAGLVALTICVLKPYHVKFYDILSAALVFAYGTGALNSVIAFTNAADGAMSHSTVAEYWITRTMGQILVACGLLHIAGRADTRGWLLPDVSFTVKELNRVLGFALLAGSAYTFLLLTGRIGFMANISVDGGAAISPLAALVMAVGTPCGALALCAALAEKRRTRIFLLTGISLFLLLSQFGLGRRIFLFSAILYAMVLFMRVPAKMLRLRSFAYFIVAMLLVQIATDAFYSMRMAYWKLDTTGANVSVLQLIPEAVQIYTHEHERLQENASKNIQTRTFVIEYLADIAEHESERGPLYGLDLHRAAIVATPSALFKSKFQNKLFTPEEDLINPYFGLPIWDAANSILTAGMADFGSTGLFIYPFALCLMYSLLCRIAAKVVSPITLLLLGLSICQILLSVEADIANYISTLRNLLIFMFVCSLLFPKISSEPRSLQTAPKFLAGKVSPAGGT
jgi:hypothetical protein